jgi:hypothetical protein
MSNTKREPVLSNADLNEKFRVKHNEEYDGYAHGTAGFNTAAYVRDIYEAARAKDAELIQMLVDDLRLLRIEFGNRVGQTTEIGIASLSDAEDAGFKPSDR